LRKYFGQRGLYWIRELQLSRITFSEPMAPLKMFSIFHMDKLSTKLSWFSTTGANASIRDDALLGMVESWANLPFSRRWLFVFGINQLAGLNQHISGARF